MNTSPKMNIFKRPELDNETVGQGPVYTTRERAARDRPDLGRDMREIEITEYNRRLQKIRTHTRIVAIVSSS